MWPTTTPARTSSWPTLDASAYVIKARAVAGLHRETEAHEVSDVRVHALRELRELPLGLAGARALVPRGRCAAYNDRDYGSRRASREPRALSHDQRNGLSGPERREAAGLDAGELHLGDLRERHLAREELEEDDAEGVDVGTSAAGGA